MITTENTIQFATLLTLIIGLGRILVAVGSWKTSMDAGVARLERELDKLNEKMAALAKDKKTAWEHIQRLEASIERES